MVRVHELPNIGAWYWDIDNQEQFEIVATDNEGGIEIQYFDGSIEAIDLDTWYNLRIVSIAPPKDWTGPFELEKEDYQEVKGAVQHPEEGHPLDSLE